jgi:nucleoside-diphosphate-sugar epimerase
MTSPTLVTGATGFIGRHIVRRLVADGVPVSALVRPRNGYSAGARVAAALEPVGDGIEVVEGDLALPGLGLSTTTLARLRRDIERVIHCAGDTSFSPHALDAFRATLVSGPLSLLRTLAGHRLRRWIHLSTAFVCGAREGVVREDEGDVGQSFHNAYEQAKLESEAAVRSAASALEVDVRIVRPSIVVGSGAATPGARPSNVLFGLIRMAAALAARPGSSARVRIPARPDIRFNFIPIEDLVRVVAVVAEGRRRRGWHLPRRARPFTDA